MSTEDTRIVLCEACGSEGRIYHGDGSERWHWSEPCPYCEGTGGEMIEAEPIEEADLWCVTGEPEVQP